MHNRTKSNENARGRGPVRRRARRRPESPALPRGAPLADQRAHRDARAGDGPGARQPLRGLGGDDPRATSTRSPGPAASSAPTAGRCAGKRPRTCPLVLKQTLHRAEKMRIAQAAARLIRDGETIILDSGTTTARIAGEIASLRLRSLTVITNALNIATALADLAHVRLIMIGGLLRQVSSSLVGPQAEQVLRGLHADRLFLGVDSLDPEIGLMTPDVLEAQLNALMIEVSQEVVAVADASKFRPPQPLGDRRCGEDPQAHHRQSGEPRDRRGAARPGRRGDSRLRLTTVMARPGAARGRRASDGTLADVRGRHDALLGRLGSADRAAREARISRRRSATSSGR